MAACLAPQEEVVPEAEAEAASAAARQQSSASTAAYEAVLAAAGIPLPPLSTAACLQVREMLQTWSLRLKPGCVVKYDVYGLAPTSLLSR